MNRCKAEIDILREEVEYDIWVFRWLWLLNLAGLVWGIALRRWDVAVIAGLSAIISLVGIGRGRRGRRLVQTIQRVCLPDHTPKPEQE